MSNKIDSNSTGLSFAEEASPKVLPANPVFYELEPNSYDDFGGDITTVARNPINNSRQRRKGTVTDLDASGGFNQDLTQNNLTRLLQGFLFADIRQKGTTKPFEGNQIAVTAVAATAKQYSVAGGNALWDAGSLILASGFTNSANNGVKTVSAVTSSLTTVAETIIDEASPPAAAKLQAVGYAFASGDVSLTVSGGLATLASAAKDLTTLGLNVGEWVFLGGGTTGTNFASNSPGYARIQSIAAGAIVFDKVTWANPATDAGTGKTLKLFFGDFLRNEKDPSLIVQRTYNLQRTLGRDANGVQSEYLEGATPNELKLNIPQADKLNVDLSFAAMDSTQRDGTLGPKSAVAGASFVASLNEDAFNTSSNVYRMCIAIVDPTNSNPTPLFGFVTEAELSINNNIEPTKAIGTLGAFDTSAGTFEVSGSVTAYFTTIAAVQAFRNNADVTFDLIFAKRNAAVILDLPLIGLSGGRVTVEQDTPIMLPVDKDAYEGPQGFTLGLTFLPYVPSVGMPA